ncbi:hypothetical protein GOODEAATRI_016692, partial [Goodea atripinnis]
LLKSSHSTPRFALPLCALLAVQRASPYVLCRCCPCHLLEKAKRGAVARLDKLIALKDSASSMYLIRKYQVGDTDTSSVRLAHNNHVSCLPSQIQQFDEALCVFLTPPCM